MTPAFHEGLEQKVGERAVIVGGPSGTHPIQGQKVSSILCNSDIKLLYISIKVTRKKIISISFTTQKESRKGCSKCIHEVSARREEGVWFQGGEVGLDTLSSRSSPELSRRGLGADAAGAFPGAVVK